MDIIDRVFDLITKRTTTAAELARGIGVDTSYTTNWKKRKASPSVENIAKIAAYFGVTTDYLINGEEPAKNSGSVSEAQANEYVKIQKGDAITAEIINVVNNLKRKDKAAVLTFACELEEKENS